MDVATKDIKNLADADNIIKDMKNTIRDLSTCISDMANLLLGDAYTYKVIIEAESSQVPVASREQHASGIVEGGSEVTSVDLSTLSSAQPNNTELQRIMEGRLRIMSKTGIFNVIMTCLIQSMYSPQSWTNISITDSV